MGHRFAGAPSIAKEALEKARFVVRGGGRERRQRHGRTGHKKGGWAVPSHRLQARSAEGSVA
ncbi:hypothetical protein GCM10015535_52490 [Streptomyces gelaticus]|uniref:Uncharacterized protein n=1 Tax=Streptomyces gelaticus TaxID=285446 RepID=A0ABQ2W6L6_9ACTN|nr:hypothetical protein GCM10015535_52490 [Streptomyces gelaticus]